MSSKPTIGILGAGKLGTVLGRLAVNAGYPVYISGSASSDKIALTVEVLVPGAIPTTNKEAMEKANVIILALPLGKRHTIPKVNLENKVVIDAMNYWWEVDGETRIPSDPNLSSTELVSKELHFPKIVKAFNHMGYHDLEFETHADTPKIIAYSGDDESSKSVVHDIIADFGFEPLDLGNLKNGIVLEPGSPLFGANLPKDEFLNILNDIKKD